MRYSGVSLWENGSSAFHRTSHDCPWLNKRNRPGKRAITLWQSICHKKLQVSFSVVLPVKMQNGISLRAESR